MAKEAKFKCMHCGNEWPVPSGVKPEADERVCPKCRSNSVRYLKGENEAT